MRTTTRYQMGVIVSRIEYSVEQNWVIVSKIEW
jgi:hypothetical protein